jgi:hypothetical protein
MALWLKVVLYFAGALAGAVGLTWVELWVVGNLHGRGK